MIIIPSPGSNLLLNDGFAVLVFADLLLHLRRDLRSDFVALEHCRKKKISVLGLEGKTLVKGGLTERQLLEGAACGFREE